MNKLLIAHNAIKSAVKIQPWEKYGHQVNFLKSYGGQHFMLDYVPNNLTELEMQYKITGYGSDATALYGARLSTSSNGFSYFQKTINNSEHFTAFGGATTPVTTSIFFTEGMDLAISHKRSGITINNTSCPSGHFRNFSSIPPKLTIFAMNTNGIIDTRKGIGELSKLIIKENGEEKVNLIFIKTDKQQYGEYPINSYLPWDLVTNTVPTVYGKFGGG